MVSRFNKKYRKGRQRSISKDNKLIKEATQPPSPPYPKNTLREQTGKPLHQPPAYQSCHIWTKLGEQEGIENSITLFISPSNANPLPSTPNHFNMFLFTLLLPKWSNPACHLTQSFVLTEAFFLAKKHWLVAGIKCFGVVRVEKALLCMGTVSLTTSHPPDRKSALLWKSEIFSSWSTQSSRTKRWSVLNKKRCCVKRFYGDSCFSSTYTPSLLKMSEKGAAALNRGLLGTRPNISFRIISPPSLGPIHTCISICITSISEKIHSDFKSQTEHVANKEQLSLFSSRGEGGVNKKG